MGLPGSGKTTLATKIVSDLFFKDILWLNADAVREKYNDWDFSEEGRNRQGSRMRQLAEESDAEIVLVDMVAPLVAMRANFAADITIWVDTIKEGRFADTNAAFVPPDKFELRVNTQNAIYWAARVIELINR